MAEKTNVCRILDQKKIPYKLHDYSNTDAVSGLDVARVLNEEADCVFKTLVTVAKSGQHYVFCIPVSTELDLKNAAKAVGEKSVEMIKQKELLPLTGYVHGGCSPVGMKKQFVTTIDESVILYDTIFLSAGKIGFQIEIAPDELKKAVDYATANIAY
ncbi:MAG: Cys-tRNA(Pro) deacylase [Clostridia bacterium]|nr:Cys-tRNA(Pro) deacylase [Clostridia bacterium]